MPRELLTILVFLLTTNSAFARPPIITQDAEFAARRIASMPDGDPVSRLLMVLSARELDDAALFVLATTHPGIAEQATQEEYQLAVDYLSSLPPAQLHRIRLGETVIRTDRSMLAAEEEITEKLCKQLRIRPRRFEAMRVGPLEGRIFRVEVNYRKRGNTETRSLELAWPSTPQRDEQSRETLTRYFGARPSQLSMGPGAPLPIADISFEEDNTLSTHWELRTAQMIDIDTPVVDIGIDSHVAIDGFRSLRFHASSRTRLFRMATQTITVVQGMRLQARAYIKADNLRAELQQREENVYLGLSFLDIRETPVAPPQRHLARLETHPWELLEVTAVVPPGTSLVRIELISAVSGTAWFDGVTLKIAE